METALTTAGTTCLIAAIIGGGFKLAGIDFPVISSYLRQALLALLGLVFIVVAYFVRPSPTPPAAPVTAGNFRPCAKGTWNVIVKSMNQDPGEAIAKIEEMRKQYPHFQFELIATTAADQISNGRYTIVVGHGLPEADANSLLSATRMAHIGSPVAYKAQYQYNGDCTHLPKN